MCMCVCIYIYIPPKIDIVARLAIKHVTSLNACIRIFYCHHCLDVACHCGCCRSQSAIRPALSSQHGQGHALLSYVGRTLLRLADEFCLAVITTNFTSKSRIEAECKPSLGISWAGIPSTRVWLRRDHAATASATGGSAGAEASLQITATVVKSNRLETGACTSLRL